jgi:hypothetical protein
VSCTNPIGAWIDKSRKTEKGKQVIIFNNSLKNLNGNRYEGIYLNCGRCIGCRLERSRQWAIRCLNEAELYEDNCFITLTYNNDNLPEDKSVHVEDFQKFMKRFRKKYKGFKAVQRGEKVTFPIRYFHCGEYGEKLSRPHYHACIFNFDFKDKELWSVRDGINLYRSNALESLWPFGYSTIGDVTFESAAYVARYITKKITGDQSKDHYQGKNPEYVSMSRRPGIGTDFYKQFGKELYNYDEMIVRKDIKLKPPKFYDTLYEIDNPIHMQEIKERRKLDSNNEMVIYPSRRKAVKRINEKHLKQLKRGVESNENEHLCNV